MPGSGKTEAAKNVARLLDRNLFIVNFENLIDSKLGQTNKNIINAFKEINSLENSFFFSGSASCRAFGAKAQRNLKILWDK